MPTNLLCLSTKVGSASCLYLAKSSTRSKTSGKVTSPATILQLIWDRIPWSWDNSSKRLADLPICLTILASWTITPPKLSTSFPRPPRPIPACSRSCNKALIWVISITRIIWTRVTKCSICLVWQVRSPHMTPKRRLKNPFKKSRKSLIMTFLAQKTTAWWATTAKCLFWKKWILCKRSKNVKNCSSVFKILKPFTSLKLTTMMM